MKNIVLIVDDMEENRLVLREILKGDYYIEEAENGQQALDILFGLDVMPQAVLLDIVMPVLDGFEVLTQMKAHWKTKDIPVLFITAADSVSSESRALKMGAMDYITKPFNPSIVKARLDNCVQLCHYRANLEETVRQKTMELTDTHEHMMETLATIIEYRSFESSTHIRRTGILFSILVEHLLEKESFSDRLRNSDYSAMIKAASLHDIGKVAIPDEILLKPSRLTPDEYEIIKKHTIFGAEIIDSISNSVTDNSVYLKHCKDICRSHHERWDGNGYPDSMAGEEIPLSARIMAAVDVYDALANPRCYKPAYPHSYCMELITEGRATQFDPNIIDALIEIEDEFSKIQEVFGDHVLLQPQFGA